MILVVLGGFFYFRNEVYYSHGSYAGQKLFTISQGEGNAEIAGRLESEGLVVGKYYFYYYIRTHGLLNEIMPGDYQLSGSLTIPEISHIITNAQQKFVKVTFPEGFTAVQMAARLTASGLPGDQFLQIVDNPGNLKSRYGYLNNVKTLEGYLFPDTYFFKPDVSAQEIVLHLLDNFDSKLDSQMRTDIAKNNHSVANTVTMASIAQKEVQAPADMQTVAGIFWKRLAAGQKLQSDATLSYILKDKIDSHSGAA
ncbi:MAG: endolytic transglycosylase MltG, partial [Candidatus Pacebacteria bacterium]|nr:endolytic transglycosylase MltG [Candidatus Paceibacterota bacterium]